MKMHIKRASFVMNIVAIVVTCVILIGATFAWFTDSVTSTSNKIQAGSLKVDLELLDKEQGWKSLKDDNAPIFDYDKWEPGYTDIKILKIENEDTLALQWKAKFVCDTALTALSQVIEVFVLPSATPLAYPQTREIDNYTLVGTVADFVNGIESTTKGVLLGGEKAYLGIALKMQSLAGNEYQGLSLGAPFDISIVATQVSSESDGIDNAYDSNSAYPTLAYNPQTLKDAMLIRNAKIVLETDIVVDSSTPLQWGSYMFVANGREVTIDLNGHDIVLSETASTKILYMFTTANGGTLNIVGDGNLIVKNKKSGIVWGMNPNDQVNIYGGNFISNSVEGSTSDCQHLLYVNRGKIDVYGGRFYYPSGEWCANADNSQGNRLGIIFHEGTILQQSSFQSGDDTRIQLAGDCEIVPIEIDGETWYQVCLID